MTERFRVKTERFHVVYDSDAAEDAPQVIHYEGRDGEFAARLAEDLNTNHANALAAQERVQQGAREEAARVALEIAEQGRGEDNTK